MINYNFDFHDLLHFGACGHGGVGSVFWCFWHRLIIPDLRNKMMISYLDPCGSLCFAIEGLGLLLVHVVPLLLVLLVNCCQV